MPVFLEHFVMLQLLCGNGRFQSVDFLQSTSARWRRGKSFLPVRAMRGYSPICWFVPSAFGHWRDAHLSSVESRDWHWVLDLSSLPCVSTSAVDSPRQPMSISIGERDHRWRSRTRKWKFPQSARFTLTDRFSKFANGRQVIFVLAFQIVDFLIQPALELRALLHITLEFLLSIDQLLTREKMKLIDWPCSPCFALRLSLVYILVESDVSTRLCQCPFSWFRSGNRRAPAEPRSDRLRARCSSSKEHWMPAFVRRVLLATCSISRLRTCEPNQWFSMLSRGLTYSFSTWIVLAESCGSSSWSLVDLFPREHSVLVEREWPDSVNERNAVAVVRYSSPSHWLDKDE